MQGTAIRSIELYKLFVPLKEPFVISLGPIHTVQNVVVIIRTEDGCAGYGECSPYMTINGESVDTCFIVGQYFAKVLKDKNALDIAGCTEAMDKTIYANNSIKSAFDIALHDIAAQHSGVPLYRFLGGDKNKVLETDMTVSIGEPQKMKEDARRFQAEGFPAIKVKLGGTKEDDVARIRAIREGIGSNHPLRIDANQGWGTADYAIDVLQALAEYGIEHCEEPIARYRFMELPRVSAASPIPIMADESCGDDHDAERLIALKACPMFNIKLGKSGGFFKGKKIADLGAAAGLHMQVGGFMESRLGMTAAAHLALSNAAIHHCDFDTPLMFTEDPVIGGISYLENGVIDVPETPGLGAVIDESYLRNAECWIL
ncbi:mandelate racemase/muconate lactonizing enzyme family protein [Flavisolibacter nicotianae]|uniref:mandelate racemase/muconate lactonizing enzyme family protein n=1 Tax=Flavisolibacter nicotianae TaxID=2364882 RepID=UPI000EB25548|nr:dipeptide epimerase [Flavisolibacter nicotianae]